jgi:hypothetical protein
MSDFDELPEDFDPSAHKGADFELIPVDWYPAHIIENAVRAASTGNGTYLFTVFEILDGAHRGRKIFQNITLQNSSQQAVEIGASLLKGIYEAIGHTGPTRDIQIMLFKPVKVRVGIQRDKKGIYDDSNCISKVKPPDYEPKRGSGPSPSRTSAPVTPNVTPNKGAVSPSTPAAAAASPSKGDAPWR